MIKLLVTGGNGFIGRSFIKLAINNGIFVRATVRELPQNRLSGVQYVVVKDINSSTDWSVALHDINTVVHCAGRAHLSKDVNFEEISLINEANIDGVVNLAKQALKNGVSRFIFLSSVGVLGDYASIDNPMTEKSAYSPCNPYSHSKMMAELQLFEICNDTNMSLTVIRPPLVYGPGAPGNFNLLKRIVMLRLPLPFGSINNVRSFVSINNLCNFIMTCINNVDSAGEVFLISDDADLSTPSFVTKMAVAANVNLRLFPFRVNLLHLLLGFFGREKSFQGLSRDFVVDCSKAKNILNWQPIESVDSGLYFAFRNEKI